MKTRNIPYEIEKRYKIEKRNYAYLLRKKIYEIEKRNYASHAK